MVDLVRPEYGEMWASQGEKVAPTQTKMELGWVQEMLPFQWQNFLENRQDSALSYLLQKGVPEYSASQEYIAQKSIVLYQGVVYMATQTVAGVVPSTPASWKRVSTISDNSGVVTIAGGGTGATTATLARTNLGLGTAATLNADVLVQKDVEGNFTAGIITASLAGNATTADKLKTTRTIQLTGAASSTPASFDGSANISITTTALDATSLTAGTVPVDALGNAVTKTSETGSARLPSGTTAQQDSPAEEAFFRYNRTTKLPEFYDGVSWKSLSGLNTGNFVQKTSSVGAAILPEGPVEDRPATLPDGGLLRANNTAGDYFFEIRNRSSSLWDALATRPWTTTFVAQQLSNFGAYTIVYPNGGSAGAPANAEALGRYEVPNPFPGKPVICSAEILVGGKWSETGWVFTGASSHGVYASLFDGKIVTQVGNYVAAGGVFSGCPNPAIVGSFGTPSPVRVKVWRIGE